MSEHISKNDIKNVADALYRLSDTVEATTFVEDKTEELSIHLANLGTLQTILYTYTYLIVEKGKEK